MDAHSHVGEDTTTNINYANFYIKNCNALSADGNGGTVKNISFRNIVIDTLRSGQEGIRVADSENVIIDNINFKTTVAGEYGISLDTCSNTLIKNSQFEDFASTVEPIYFKNTTILNTTIKNCLFKNLLGHALQGDTVSDLNIINCEFDNITSEIFYIITNLNKLKLVDCNFKNLTNKVFSDVINVLSNSIITGCTFTPKSTSSEGYNLRINGIKITISNCSFSDIINYGGLFLHAESEDIITNNVIFVISSSSYAYYDNGSERSSLTGYSVIGVPTVAAVSTKGADCILANGIIQNDDIYIRSTASHIHTIANTLQNGVINEEVGGLANHVHTANIEL